MTAFHFKNQNLARRGAVQEVYTHPHYPDILIGHNDEGEIVTIRHVDRVFTATYHTASLLREILDMVPPPNKRHSAGANRSRREAGHLALTIEDVELRTAVLDKLDLWSGLFSSSSQKIVKAPWLGANIVRLVCPSTGRVYAHVVPEECRTFDKARAWIMTAHAPAWAKNKPIGKIST